MVAAMFRRLLLAALIAVAVMLPAGSLAAEEATRLRVVLILDASGSMAGNDPQLLVRVASKMLSDLADERDHVTVLSFGSEVKKLKAARGNEHTALRAAIDGLGRHESCTDYGQALERAAGLLPGKPPPGERRVVLFLTDGRFEPVEPNKTCGPFESAKDEDRQAIIARVEKAAGRFKEAGARVFTIGLGNAPSRAEHSAALLKKVAAITGGQFLHAKGPRDVPRIFASIFGALVGAPIMQESLDKGRQSVTFTIPKGADRLHVVLVPDQPRDLDKVALKRGGAAVGMEPARVENGTSSSYRLARVIKEASGSYTLTGSGTGRIDVLVIPDVGLSLRIEGIPKVLPEGVKLKGGVALRTRLGDAVKLMPQFLEHVVFKVEMGEAKLFDQRPSAAGEANFRSSTPLKRGKYKISASAAHSLGFLDVPAVEHSFSVEPRFTLALTSSGIHFKTMAEEGSIPVEPKAVVEVARPDVMPTDITVNLELPEDVARDIDLQPQQITFGPDKPRKVELKLRWKDPKKLRGKRHHYHSPIKLLPLEQHAKLLVGEQQWQVPVDAKLRAWTWQRYLAEYKWQIIISLLLLLIIVYVIGRVIAQKFPPKARIYYVEVGQQFESDSLIRRYASHGAYRSAKFKFPLGKKARPLAFFKSTGAGFEVIAAERVTVTILDDDLPEDDRERRKPFKGRWQQRYRLSDRYEVWLARTRIED